MKPTGNTGDRSCWFRWGLQERGQGLPMDWICGIERNQGQLPSLKMGRWEDNCPITEMGVRAHELVWGWEINKEEGRAKV